MTGNRAPVFSQTVLAKLKAEFPGPGLPFRQFDLERRGAAIRFEAEGRPYVFAADSLVLHRLAVPARVGPLDLATTEPGKYSPTYRHDAFIRDYDNLYLLDTQTGSEEPIVQGTSEDNLIGFLGAGSWFVWSSDGKRIGYLKADQRGFHRYPVLHDQDRKATVEFFRYPFTVDSDPPLELHVYELGTKRDVPIRARPTSIRRTIFGSWPMAGSCGVPRRPVGGISICTTATVVNSASSRRENGSSARSWASMRSGESWISPA